MHSVASQQARHWRTAAAALELLRHRTQVTRRDVAAALGLGSGPASDLAARLRAARLVIERPAPAHGRGRPTTSLHAHPEGPVVLALDLRHGDWRLAACGLDGELEMLASAPHPGNDPTAVLARLRTVIAGATQRLCGRALALAVAVPGLVTGSRLLDASVAGWRDVDLCALGGGLPVLPGNDATMAAVAVARTHPATETLLHLVVEIGIGGALVVGGRPVRGARGLAGEFGHLPFGDHGQVCGCGARGCWAVQFDPGRIASALGEPAPDNPRLWLRRLFDPQQPSAQHQRVLSDLAGDLGRGAAGLVNALDPGLVTLGGLAGSLRDCMPAAFDAALAAGLMDVHRSDPPPVIAGPAGDDAVLVGVALTALDQVLDARALALWAAGARSPAPAGTGGRERSHRT